MAKKKVSKPAAKKKSTKKPPVKKAKKAPIKRAPVKKPPVRKSVVAAAMTPGMTMEFNPRSDLRAIDSTVNQTFTGWAQPFVAGMSITVTMTGGVVPRTFNASVTNNFGTANFSVVVPAADMAPNTGYVLVAHSSAGHPDAQLSFHTKP